VEGLRVTAVFIQEFYRLAGRFQLELEVPEGATVRDLIVVLDSIIPGFRERVMEGDSLRYPVEVAVNGRRIDFLKGLETRLRDGDKVLFSPRALFVV